MQSDIDAMRRELADTRKRLDKAEAAIERMKADWPRRSRPEQLVNQTYRREYIAGAGDPYNNLPQYDPLGR